MYCLFFFPILYLKRLAVAGPLRCLPVEEGYYYFSDSCESSPIEILTRTVSQCFWKCICCLQIIVGLLPLCYQKSGVHLQFLLTSNILVYEMSGTIPTVLYIYIIFEHFTYISEQLYIFMKDKKCLDEKLSPRP